MTAQPFSGVLVPVLTPFTASGEPDAARFTAFCRWLLDQGAGGLAIFGTTSEANSMSPAERMALLDHLVEAGIPAGKADAGDRRLRDDRRGGAGAARCRPWLRRRSDAAALLLQAGQRRRHLRLYFRRHRQGRLVGAEGLSLSYSAGRGGRLLARSGRAFHQGLSADRGRVEGQFRRLEQHRGVARPLSGLCHIPGLRGVSARRAAQGRGRLHHRLGQCQRAGHRQALRQLAGTAGRRLAGRSHDRAHHLAALSDGAGAEAGRRSFPRRSGLGRGAPADAAARPGAIGGIDRRPRQDRLYPRANAGRRRLDADLGGTPWRRSRRPPGHRSARRFTSASPSPIWRRYGSGCMRW